MYHSQSITSCKASTDIHIGSTYCLGRKQAISISKIQSAINIYTVILEKHITLDWMWLILDRLLAHMLNVLFCTDHLIFIHTYLHACTSGQCKAKCHTSMITAIKIHLHHHTGLAFSPAERYFSPGEKFHLRGPALFSYSLA